MKILKTVLTIVLGVVALAVAFTFANKQKMIDQQNDMAAAVQQVPDVKGCYVATLGNDVYTLSLTAQDGQNVSGTLAYKNFQKDSSAGTFVGTFSNDILVGDYSFSSEGMDSVSEVIFKKEGDAFVQGFGEIQSAGNKTTLADKEHVTYDKHSTFTKTDNCSPAVSATPSSAAQKISFEGTVTAYDTGCFVDATCSVTVSGKKVILVTGGRAMAGATPGALLGVDSIGDLDKKIGSKAQVYALKLSDKEYTLYGNSEYYVKVL